MKKYYCNNQNSTGYNSLFSQCQYVKTNETGVTFFIDVCKRF